MLWYEFTFLNISLFNTFHCSVRRSHVGLKMAVTHKAINTTHACNHAKFCSAAHSLILMLHLTCFYLTSIHLWCACVGFVQLAWYILYFYDFVCWFYSARFVNALCLRSELSRDHKCELAWSYNLVRCIKSWPYSLSCTQSLLNKLNEL